MLHAICMATRLAPCDSDFFFQTNAIKITLSVHISTVLKNPTSTTDLQQFSVKKHFLRSPKHRAMKTYGGVEVQLQSFLASARDGTEWSATRPGRFTTGERAPRRLWSLGGPQSQAEGGQE